MEEQSVKQMDNDITESAIRLFFDNWYVPYIVTFFTPLSGNGEEFDKHYVGECMTNGKKRIIKKVYCNDTCHQLFKSYEKSVHQPQGCYEMTHLQMCK